MFEADTSMWLAISPVAIFDQCTVHENLADVELLSVQERTWLDAFHNEVYEKVPPLRRTELEWLERECSSLQRYSG